MNFISSILAAIFVFHIDIDCIDCSCQPQQDNQLANHVICNKKKLGCKPKLACICCDDQAISLDRRRSRIGD